ncbi:MAG: hypothetical protein KFKLKKLM_01559 [Flavobacteriales bacterium]|nr:hypothetical protein [Flavobacteriales bacterium]
MKNIATFFVIMYVSFLTVCYAQSPGGVSANSTNQFWLDAFQQNGTNGSDVSSWNDFSGNNNHANQTTSNRRPKFSTNAINGMPAVQFDGGDDMLEISANNNFNSNMVSHFLVYETSTLNAGANLILNMDFDEASNLLFSYATPTSSIGMIKNSSNSAKYNTMSLSGTNQIASFLWNGTIGTLKGFLNGTNGFTTTNCINTASGHNRTRIGAFNTNYKFKGKIAEIIYFTSILNSAERNIIENYLAAKYQINVLQDKYSHELTHRYDVVGIGQESDGNNLSARGTSNLILEATTMNNGDYVLAGHDNGGYAPNTVDVPSGYNRYNQVWRSTITNYTGTVDVSFDVNNYGLGADDDYILLVDEDGVFANGATEYTGVYSSGIVTFSGVTLTSNSYFTLANGNSQVVSTGVTNDWHLTTTWTCGCIPTLGSTVNILTGHNVFINGQNALSGSLTIDGSLTFNGTDTLQINGDLINNNSIVSGSGTFYFTGASLPQTITGSVDFFGLTMANSQGLTLNNSTSVGGWLNIISGTLTTNNNLTLRSNASGTAAYYRPSSGEVVGEITVERYLNEGESWYLLAPVVSNGTLEDWNQEFEMQGFTGTEWIGGISSVYYFNQNNIVNDYNQGYTSPTNTNDIIDPKVGYEIYIGNDSKATGARTIDITGEPVLGNVSYNCPHIVKLNSPADDGWSLITNPYPAPVIFGYIQKTGAFDKAYVKRITGAYQAINNQWRLGSGEAFWVHSNVGGSTLTFQPWMAGYDLSLTDNYNLRTVQNSEIENLEIKLGYLFNDNLEHDIAFLGFANNATINKDEEQEAYKLNNIFKNKPNLSTLIEGNQRMETNILPSDANNIVVPINITTDIPTGQNGNYTLEFSNVSKMLNKNKKIRFEDRDLGVDFYLTKDTVYQFTMINELNTNRFYLHIQSPLKVSKLDITCNGANNGKLIVENIEASSYSFIWKNEKENVIKTSNNVFTNDTISNLPEGKYSLTAIGSDGTEITSSFDIIEPAIISSSFYTSLEKKDINLSFSKDLDTLVVVKGELVDFNNTSENSTISVWNFGDGITSSMNNPQHMYFNAGLYQVKLVAKNGSCESESYKYIQVDDATSIIETNLFDEVNVIVKENNLNVLMNNNYSGVVSFEVLNSLGQTVYSSSKQIASNHIEEIKLNVASGVYMLKIEGLNNSKTKKIVLN